MATLQKTQPKVPYILLRPGDAAPWFQQRTPSNPEFRFDTMGGRYVLLAFFGSSGLPVAQAASATLLKRRHYFDDENISFFGVTLDPRDETEQRLRNAPPGIRFFFDTDGHVSRLYGALPQGERDMTKPVEFRPLWILMDRMLRIVANVSMELDGSNADDILPFLDALPPFSGKPELDLTPPILMLSNVFDDDLCSHLIGLYDADGGEDSGFMNERGGKTLGTYDYSHKRRRDYFIKDEALIERMQRLFMGRVIPEIAKAFQYNVTHIERQIVACYESKDGGHFNAHRDNTTRGTAHRRFAVTLNLNDEFEGGELSFPEFGKRSFRAPKGGVIVFSCSLLHAAGVVTKGVRYAYLPFLYDEEAAKIRDANRATITDGKRPAED